MNTTAQNATQINPSVRSVLKLGLDVDLKQITVTVQSDHQHPKPAQSFSVARLVKWVQGQVGAGHTVWSVYESCGFGYTLHYQLVEAGARNLVISRPPPARTSVKTQTTHAQVRPMRPIQKSSGASAPVWPRLAPVGQNWPSRPGKMLPGRHWPTDHGTDRCTLTLPGPKNAVGWRPWAQKQNAREVRE